MEAEKLDARELGNRRSILLSYGVAFKINGLQNAFQLLPFGVSTFAPPLFPWASLFSCADSTKRAPGRIAPRISGVSLLRPLNITVVETEQVWGEVGRRFLNSALVKLKQCRATVHSVQLYNPTHRQRAALDT